MPYGELGGKTKEWTDKEIKSAAGGGVLFTPKDNTTTTSTKTTTPVSTTTTTSKKQTSPIISNPAPGQNTNPSNFGAVIKQGAEAIKSGAVYQNKPITSTPIVYDADQQIASYQKAYQEALAKNDYTGMLKASTDADNYRASIGQARQNEALIKGLQSKIGQVIPGQVVPVVQAPKLAAPVYDVDPQLAAIQKKYQDASGIGDYAGMIKAAEEADNYRLSIGQAAQNKQLITDLQGKRQEKASTALKPYQDAYKTAYANGDIQGMLTAAQQADDYRASIGEARANESLINELRSKLQGGQQVGGSIASQMPEFTMPEFNIPDYESKYTNIMNTLNQELVNDILNPESSPYRGQIEKLIQQLQDAQFNYDPSKDTNLQNAINNTSRQVMEQLNRRGILNSTITQNDIANAIANLTGQYGDLAYQRFQDTQSRQFKVLDQIQQLDHAWSTDRNNRTQQVRELASYINTLDNKDYSIYKDTVDQYYKQVSTQIEARKQEIELQRQKIKDAWERVQNLGYADNEAALILGILPGTPSKEVQAEARKQQYELDQMKTELEKQLALKQADYEVSAKLQEQRDKAENARLQYTQEQQNARTKYQEEQQNNRNYANIQASKEKAATKTTNNIYKQNYNDTITEFDSMDSEEALNEILTDPQAFKDGLGSNYSNFLKRYQDKYYNDLKSEWSSMEPRYAARILKQQTKTEGTNMTMEDYYKSRLGSTNYNKLLEEKLKDADMTLEEVMGTVSVADRRKQIGS